MSLIIIHNPLEKRFEYKVNDDIAVCDYRLDGNIWEFHHTVTPDSMRGQGVAGQLVDAALKHVDSKNGKVVPTCSYVAAYIKKHPEFSHLLIS